MGTMSNGVNNLPVDVPNYNPGHLSPNHSPQAVKADALPLIQLATKLCF